MSATTQPRALRSLALLRATRYTLAENRLTLVACGLFGLLLLCAVFGSLVAPYDSLATDMAARLKPPRAVHLFGTDLARAKQLLAEAGFPNGFKTTVSYDLSQATTREPIALLLQESLGKIGIEVSLEKVPSANWFTQMAAKTMPLVITEFYGWLVPPEYFYFWNFDGKNNAVFNTANYVNLKLDTAIDAARFESDTAKYEADLVQMNDIVMGDLPRIPLARLLFDVAMQTNVKGYVSWFHMHIDYRTMSKV